MKMSIRYIFIGQSASFPDHEQRMWTTESKVMGTTPKGVEKIKSGQL